MRKYQTGGGELGLVLLILVAAFVLFGGVGSCMYVMPKYNVYKMEMHGKAVLAEAESSRQVAVREALALKDSAQFKAEAEVIRAKGVAQPNEIIGDSLKGHDEYLRYLYIDTMHNTQNQIVYIPTEGGIPILEATRLAPKPEPAPDE